MRKKLSWSTHISKESIKLVILWYNRTFRFKCCFHAGKFQSIYIFPCVKPDRERKRNKILRFLKHGYHRCSLKWGHGTAFDGYIKSVLISVHQEFLTC
jgi:hypothetical protein